MRQAISHALDREKIHRIAGFGFGQRSDGPFPKGLADWYNADQPSYPYDIKKANQLLDEAGYPKDDMGIRFKLGMELIAGMPVIINICEMAREQLKEVGIDFVLNIRDMASHTDLVYSKWNFDCTNAAHGLQFDPSFGYARYLVTKMIGNIPWTNCGAYSNPKVDDLFEKASLESDAKKRKTRSSS